MVHLALMLFGPLHATLDGVPVPTFESQKGRALLAYLALEADRPQPRDALASLLWPDQPEQDARNNLRQALSNLRQALGDQRATPSFLRITSTTIQFDRASDHYIDVVAFMDLLDTCAQHPHRRPETCTSCARRLQQAAALYDRDFLDPFFLRDSGAFEEWAIRTRERLHHCALQALVQLANYYEQREEYAQAQPYAWRQIELAGWREESHRQLMRLLVLSGQRSEALVQYAACRRILAAELGVEPEPETTVLAERIQRGEAIGQRPTPPGPERLLRHAPLAPLIGREAKLAQLADRLEDRHCRLLTLVGPGGVGKTRLAIQAAVDLRHAFADGVAFVPLAPVRSMDLLVSTIATALDVTVRDSVDSKAQLLAHLRKKDMLLLLDNFEQLVHAAPLVSELLAGAPDLTIMVTSRTPLQLSGEQEFAVPPLNLPPWPNAPRRASGVPHTPETPSVAELARSEAVHLFIERAQAVKADFRIANTNAAAVVAICHRLDGLPLAIELAAARVKLFTPEALLARLSSRLDLLTGGARDLPARQQTIRNTIAWSYDLLNDAEQTLFRQLGVFVGGCTLVAAEAVCAGDVLESLTQLVNKSLVQVEQCGGAVRYGLLETTREYGLEKLAASGQTDSIRSRHAAYFLTLAESAPAWHELQHVTWLAQLETEHDNLRAALQWTDAQPSGDIEMRLAGALGWFWYRRGDWSEWRTWLQRVLVHDRSTGRSAAQAWFLYLHGEEKASQGDAAGSQTLFEESVAHFQALGDTYSSTIVQIQMAVVAREQGDAMRATALFEELLNVARNHGNAEEIAWAQNALGEVAVLREDVAAATALLNGSLAQFRALGVTYGVARALNFLGHVAQLMGDYVQAIELHRESLSLFSESHLIEVGWALEGLGEAALGQSDLTVATAHFTASLHIFQGRGDPAIVWSLAGLGSVATLCDQPERAVRLWGAVEAARKMTGKRVAPASRPTYERAVAAARAQLSAEAFAAAWAAGCALSVNAAMAEALAAG